MSRLVLKNLYMLALGAMSCGCLLVSPAGAQTIGESAGAQTIAGLFKQMPEELMPYLTTNNRLDMIDFMDAHMKAEVTNLLEGKSEMTALSDSALTVRLSDALTVDMQLATRGDSTVVRLTKTYHTLSRQTEVVTYCYSTDWRLIDGPYTESTFSVPFPCEEPDAVAPSSSSCGGGNGSRP